MLTSKALWLRGRDGDRSAWFVLGVRIFAATVWFVFGTIFKVMNIVPRHREIVATIVGTNSAPSVTVVIGLLESALGFWALSGIRPRSCAIVQTVAIISMNTLELIHARSFLLAPIPMVCANAIFLAFVWYAALWTRAK
jgi:hypothetical protein